MTVACLWHGRLIITSSIHLYADGQNKAFKIINNKLFITQHKLAGQQVDKGRREGQQKVVTIFMPIQVGLRIWVMGFWCLTRHTRFVF